MIRLVKALIDVSSQGKDHDEGLMVQLVVQLTPNPDLRRVGAFSASRRIGAGMSSSNAAIAAVLADLNTAREALARAEGHLAQLSSQPDPA